LESDAVIVGGGFVGAYLSSRMGDLNTILLERSDFKKHSTGLVSRNLFNLFNVPKNIVVNTIKAARVVFPDKRSVVFKGEAYVIDTPKFHQYLMDRSDAKLLREEFIDFKGNIVKTSKRKIRTEVIIGADGADSSVAKKIGVRNNFITGVEVVAPYKTSGDTLTIYLGNAPGFFSWVVPENKDTARIGLATYYPYDYMKRFLSELGVKKAYESYGGLIPIDFHDKMSSYRTLIVGDAAAHTKATTGGGIVTGMIAADIASDAVRKAFELKEFSAKFFRYHYDRKVLSTVGRELKLAYWIRRIMNTFTREDYNTLYEIVNSPSIKSVLNSADMEFYSKFIYKLLSNPKFLLFAARLGIRSYFPF